MSHSAVRAAAFGALVAAAGFAGGTAAAEVIATGLNNPRGLAFSPGGRLYVAEAGHGGDGPCIPNPEPNAPPERCYGDSGAVVRVHPWRGADPTASWERVISNLPSLAAQVDDPATPFSEVGMRAGGPIDISFLGWDAYLLMSWGGDPAERQLLGDRGKMFGTVLDLDLSDLYGKGPSHWRHRRTKIVADIAAHEGKHNPDGEFGGAPDSNPNGLDVLPFRIVVADSGANTIVEASILRRTRTLALFPPRCVSVPPPPPAPGPAAGCAVGEWNIQSVPTSVTRGPDGALYTSELTGFPFPEGAARIYRTMPWGGDSTVHFDGFTNVIDVAFDYSGNAYVLEIGHRLPPFGAPNSGGIIKVDAVNGARTQLATGLSFPGGIAVGPDRALYVTNNGIFVGAGEVVRIPLP